MTLSKVRKFIEMALRIKREAANLEQSVVPDSVILLMFSLVKEGLIYK